MLMELCGPARQRIIDIVGRVVRPCESISEIVKQVNETFEMPEIELCPTIRFKIRPIRIRWEAFGAKKYTTAIYTHINNFFFFRDKMRGQPNCLPGIFALTATSRNPALVSSIVRQVQRISLSLTIGFDGPVKVTSESNRPVPRNMSYMTHE